ncbi:GIY-YIG nuclease family protein [Aurantiacibacter gilvus]|uniref:GIY-YIG nuclease family protein n=1 Tax=Aurantiacibacter gilvus TaxID=3139141 RepID=A0ABU9IBE4_9SPHN
MNRLLRLFPGARTANMPVQSGAYLLTISLGEKFAGSLRGKPYELPAGTYVYAGSANGPGGVAARVARHMRKDKKLHWHVDALTVAASEITAFAFPGGNECALVERLLGEGYEAPLPGFGSSDCRSCPAHLLRLQ